MMSPSELEQFAEQLMRYVRDRAIVALDHQAAGEMQGRSRASWVDLIKDDDARKLVDELIPDAVDQALFELLNALDNEELRLAWYTSDGSCVSLEELGLGEMGGWFMGSGGWRQQFSKERAEDRFKDVQEWNFDEEPNGD